MDELTSWQKWYAKNKKRHIANNKKFKKDGKRRNKAYVEEKKSVPCTDCKIQYPTCAMQFDHVRGTKVDNIAQMVVGAVSLELIQAEIDKCEVVCANCHCIRTHNRRQGSLV